MTGGIVSGQKSIAGVDPGCGCPLRASCRRHPGLVRGERSEVGFVVMARFGGSGGGLERWEIVIEKSHIAPYRTKPRRRMTLCKAPGWLESSHAVHEDAWHR